MDTQGEMKTAKDLLITIMVGESIAWGFGLQYSEDRAHRAVDRMSHEEILDCLKNGKDV